MGCREYLTDLLRPLGVYDLSDGSVNGAELGAWGAALDAVEAALGRLARESCLLTAEAEGLAAVEGLLPFTLQGTAEERRAALVTLLGLDRGSFTLESANRALGALGIDGTAAETDRPGRVVITLSGTEEEQEDFAALQAAVAGVLPCHLQVDYVFAGA